MTAQCARVQSASPAERQAAEDTITRRLEQLASKLAAARGRKATLVCLGLEDAPATYREALHDIVAQLVRHALADAVEPVAERVAAAKPAAATLIAELLDHGEEGFELVFQDDGRGIDHERLRARAIARGLLLPRAAAQLDARRLAAFIFRPGFVQEDATDAEAIGMSGVRELVMRLGGEIGIATRSGAFTRFRISLPPVDQPVLA